MKRIALLTTLLAIAFTAAADKLDDLEKRFDAIEREYWTAIRLTGDRHQAMERQLGEALGMARDIQRQKRQSGKNDLTKPLMTMERIFFTLRGAEVQKFSTKFSTTSMRDYRSEFRKWLREQQEREREKDEDRSRKRRQQPVDPTLANVDLAEYSTWLGEIMQKNTEKLRNSSNGNTTSKEKAVRDLIYEYHGAVNALRNGMAELRQSSGGYQFK